MKSLLPILTLTFAMLLSAAPAADPAEEPQDAWMLHLDGLAGSLRFVPDRIVLVPGGTVQLMVFGQGHGRYTVTLDDAPASEAEVDTAGAGVVHVAEFAAPLAPGEYPFHDRHHPEARGVLVVKAAGPDAASATPAVGVGNGYDTTFYPARLAVRPGEPVRFTNNASEIVHTMTALDGAFDADAVRAGEERTFAAPTTPGEYAFVCKYHEETGMRGVLVVLPPVDGEAAGPEPEAQEAGEPRRDAPLAPLALVLGLVGLAALAVGRRARIR